MILDKCAQAGTGKRGCSHEAGTVGGPTLTGTRGLKQLACLVDRWTRCIASNAISSIVAKTALDFGAVESAVLSI